MQRAAAVFFASLGVAACTAPEPEHDTRPWRLAWSDEFEGAAGEGIDPARWSFELGGGGWGNQELQDYTDRRENAALDGSGALAITARQAPDRRAYTSARITTRGKLEQAYGRFEARLALPAGKGLWPAFWLLGSDRDRVGWPACGEIDIVELRGAQPWRVLGSAHGPGYAGGEAIIGSFATADHASLAGDFHVYAVEWEPGELRFSVDGQRYHTVAPADLRPGARWVFDHPFFVIVNLAVGGTFGGVPDATTPLPQSLRVDYVRVYVR
jgi:beta-glucanase (GH16 family)